MPFARLWLPALCFTLLLVCLAPRLCSAQQAPAQPATAQSAPAPAQPTTQAYTLPPDKLAKAIAINRIRNIMDIVYGLWGIVFLWLLLATRAAAALEAWAQRVFARRWLQGLLFFAVFFVLTTLANLPLDVYGHHVSRAYGIGVQGWLSWLGDQGKALGLAILIGAPVLLLFNWIVRRWPRRYWFGIWLVTLPLMVLLLFVSPLLEPIFNKYEPLTQNHAALVAKLETVVARTGTNIPPDRMFLMKASVKTNGLNAYVNGIGATKRIVVWDTTAGRIPDDEVMFIFGHESGHYVLNHIPKQLAGIALGLFFVYWACAAFASWLAHRYGAAWLLQSLDAAAAPLSTRAGFVVLILTITVAGFVLEPAANTFSRHFEHQADVYGQEAIHGLVPDPQKTAVGGFQALGEAWLEDPNPSPLIEFWEYNHPSVKTRANFAANYNPWANGGHGEFFDR
ncbi:MAG TPA: M48 family metallopeptidase [Terracidiphilus sp.]|nr:M48 family metallopeptidase [Terracidiphilus sp.]